MNDHSEDKIEKTTIVLEDTQAAIVLDENGSIYCHVPKHDNDPERYLEPHELVMLAISLKFAADTDGLLKLCGEWLEEYDNEIRGIDGITVKDKTLN